MSLSTHLCDGCHQLFKRETKTLNQGLKRHGKAFCTPKCANKHRQIKPIPTEQVCSRCGGDPQPIINFSKKRSRYRAICKACHNIYQTEWYGKSDENRLLHRVRVKANKQKHITQNRQCAVEYLLVHPCECGETDVVVLDFDHIDPSIKIDDVSRMINHGVAWSVIRQEIAKCAVRCANCHRRKTAEQFGHFRWKWSTTGLC